MRSNTEWKSDFIALQSFDAPLYAYVYRSNDKWNI